MSDNMMYEIFDESFSSKESFLLKLAEKGDVSAAYSLAMLYFKFGSFDEAHDWFAEAASEGHADAAYFMGLFYDHPVGFEVIVPDTDEALRYWTQAVELGSVLAMCELGRRYRQGGPGIERDEAKAFELFQRAAELDYHKAYYWLSVCYENGSGVEKNRDMALECLKKAYIILDRESDCD